MKKTRIIAAFLSAVTMASMLSATASAGYVPEGYTPVFDITPTVEGYEKDGKYYDKSGELVTGYSLLYFDRSYENDIGIEMRMRKADKETGEITGYYTGFTKSKAGRRYYNNGERIYGWYKIGDYWFHFDENGYADTGRTEICGAYYTFDEKGKWLNKVSKDGLAPKDFRLEIGDIHGMSSFDTDGYIYYGSDWDDKKYTEEVKFSARDRQIIYCMFLESRIAAGEETNYNDIYKLCDKYANGEGTEHLQIWETEPAFGFKVTVVCGGKTTKLVFNDACSQFAHIDEGCFDAYRFIENLCGYRLNYLYKKFPKPENVDWETIE